MNIDIIKEIQDFLIRENVYFDNTIYFEPGHKMYSVDLDSNKSEFILKDEYFAYVKFPSKNKTKKILKFKTKIENKHKDISVSFCDIENMFKK